MLQNLFDQFVQTQHTIRPQVYYNCGFEARYYFNFGEYCDPRHQLPVSIVLWRLPPAQQLKQCEHPNMDIITYVLKGGYRQDNKVLENQQLKQGDVLQYLCGNDNPWHRDSNSYEDVSEILQIFVQNIQEERGTTQQLCKENEVIGNKKFYEIKIYEGNQEIDNANFTTLIIINLADEPLLIDAVKLSKYECQYYEAPVKTTISGIKYLVIKLL